MVRPRCLSSPVRATSRMCSARCALEIQVFWPSITQPPSASRRARQRSAPTSDPAPGSDMAMASTSPRTTPDSTRRRCSSLPKLSYAFAAMTVVMNPPAGTIPYEVSSRNRQASATPPPAPPYASGRHTPSQPRAASRLVQLRVVGLTAPGGQRVALFPGAALPLREVAEGRDESGLFLGEATAHQVTS